MKTFWVQQKDFLLKAVSSCLQENIQLVLFVTEVVMKLYAS